MSEIDAWETVPDSAKRLGIGERKAYRQAAKLSDSDVKVSDSGQRLVRQSAMKCLTEPAKRQTVSGNNRAEIAVLEAVSSSLVQVPIKALSDTIEELSDKTIELSDRVSDSSALVSDSALAETERLRRDLARVEDENRFMREQLSLAMSGWREEQRRTRDLEKRMKELPAPAGAEETAQAVAPGPSIPQSAVFNSALEDKPAPTWAKIKKWFSGK